MECKCGASIDAMARAIKTSHGCYYVDFYDSIGTACVCSQKPFPFHHYIPHQYLWCKFCDLHFCMYCNNALLSAVNQQRDEIDLELVVLLHDTISIHDMFP